MNNGKYNTAEFKRKQAAVIDKKFGEMKTHTKICECCGSTFLFVGRLHTKKFEKTKFCCQQCANSVGGNAKAIKYHSDSKAHYKTVAFRHRDKHCYACGHDKILEVHHIDGNHNNNDPCNLLPLCPTHHKMIHSRWKKDVIALLEGKLFFGR